MASSAATVLKEALVVVAVCVVVLHHSSMGQQPPTPARAPASHCPYTGQTTPPPPPTTPVPVPPAAPAPTPAPVVNCSHSYCFSHCTPICEAIRAAGAAKCKRDLATNFKGCYRSCTSHVYVCHGKSCRLHGGCALGQCSSCCSNHNATSCCQGCASAVSPDYQRCQLTYNDRSVLYCINNCQDSCFKNCTQLGA